MKLTNLTKPLSYLIYASIAFRVLFLLIHAPWNDELEYLNWDALGYHQMAVQFLEHGNFILGNNGMEEWRTPGYPLFLSLIYSLFGIKSHFVIAIQLLFINTASIYLLYRFTANLISEKMGLVAATLFSFELDHIYWAMNIYSETLFIFIFLISLYSFERFLTKKNMIFLVMSALLLSISTIVRPITIYFPLAYGAIYIFYGWRTSSVSFLNFIKVALIGTSLSLVAVLPWYERNDSVYGHYELSTSTGFNLLYIYAGYTMRNIEGIGESAANEKLEGIVRDRAAAREIDLSNPFSRAVLGREVGLEYISQNKIEFLKVHFGNIIPIYINSLSLKPFLGRVFSINTTINVEGSGEFRRTEFSFGKLKYLLENTELPVTVLLLLYAAFYILLYYVMAMIGLKVLWTNKYYEALFLLFIVVIYFTLISGSIGEPRYKLPISMMYVIPAAVGLTRAWDWLLKRKSIGIR